MWHRAPPGAGEAPADDVVQLRLTTSKHDREDHQETDAGESDRDRKRFIHGSCPGAHPLNRRVQVTQQPNFALGLFEVGTRDSGTDVGHIAVRKEDRGTGVRELRRAHPAGPPGVVS